VTGTSPESCACNGNVAIVLRRPIPSRHLQWDWQLRIVDDHRNLENLLH